METIESINSAIKVFQDCIKDRIEMESVFHLPKTKHKIEIYAMCIERLSQRLIKELNKLNN